MSTLFQNVTAILMDADRTVLQNAFVAVKGKNQLCWAPAAHREL